MFVRKLANAAYRINFVLTYNDGSKLFSPDIAELKMARKFLDEVIQEQTSEGKPA